MSLCTSVKKITNEFYNLITMNTLEKQEGVYYTQNIENLPIEERLFFREGKGMSATSELYRVATADEISSWKAYQAEQEMQNWFDNANSILSSAVQENVVPLGLRSVGVVNR